MPVVGISLEKLLELVARPLERDRLIAHLGEIGCDVKGCQRVVYYRCSTCGESVERLPLEEPPKECAACTAGSPPHKVGESEVIRMELLPDRPDLFDVGGLARAVRGYLGYEVGLRIHPVSPSGYSVLVDPQLFAASSFRPYIACAVIRNLKLDGELLRGLMKLQENLHWALGRDRRRASIGVYDLATVIPDFSYRAVEKDGVRFVPLGGLPLHPSKEATPEEILLKHPKGMAYRALLEDFEIYPLLVDSRGGVLSMPPIINSEPTKVSEKTEDLFIDVTGPDKGSVAKTIRVLVTSLAELGGKIESVRVDYPGGPEVTPDLRPKAMVLNSVNASRLIGVEIGAERMSELLERMGYQARSEGSSVTVAVPAYRTDVMHQVDLVEDVAIAYGYHNIEPALVPTQTVGEEVELERLSSIVRRAMTGMGFHEVMSLMLTNPKVHYSMSNLEEPSNCVKVENPPSAEQCMVRTHLLSGLLETFKLSRTQRMPQRIFELGDVCIVDEALETGARDLRKVAGGIMDPKTGFAEVKSVLESLTRELGLKVNLEATDHPMFMEGRCAGVVRGGGDYVGTGHGPVRRGGPEGAWSAVIAVMGEVHPGVLENFDIVQPVSLFELDLTQIGNMV